MKNMKNKDQSAHTEEATQAGSNFHFLHPLQPHTGHFSVGQIPRINLKPQLTSVKISYMDGSKLSHRDI
jgi:hypothetical protein